MSFLISGIENKRGGRDASPDTLRRMGCTLCPLDKAELDSPKMDASGTETPNLYVLGEGPGAQEDEEGEAFVGLSGRFLKENLTAAIVEHAPEAYVQFLDTEPRNYQEITKLSCRFNNAIRCRPPNNRVPAWHEVECCRGYVETDIERSKPVVILALGETAFNWVLGGQGRKIMKWRGRLMPVRVGNHECFMLATAHPAYVVRAKRKNKGVAQEELMFKRDLDIAVRHAWNPAGIPKYLTVADMEQSSVQFTGHVPGELREIEQTLKLFNKESFVGYDIETDSDEDSKDRSLRPYGDGAKLLSISISNGEKTLCIGLGHQETSWSAKQREELTSLLVRFFTNKEGPVKVAHNLSFEVEWLAVLWGDSVFYENRWGDTMAQAYVLGSLPGSLNLNACCEQHLGLPLKSLVRLNVQHLADEPIEKVLRYNGFDACATYHLYEAQSKLLCDQNLLDVYDTQVRRIPTLVRTQVKGVLIDQAENAIKHADLTKAIDVLLRELREFPEIKEYEANFRSFNPGSHANCVTLFKDMLKRPEGNRGKDGYSADEKVLEQIGLPVGNTILRYRETAKLLSTYVEGVAADSKKFVWDDGRIHTNYNSLFVATRRLSSSNPNLQNWPARKHAHVKSQVTAPPGYKFVALDYGQIEFRVAAMASRDPALIEALWNRYDVHMVWAEKIQRLYPKAMEWAKKFNPGKDGMKSLRQETKNKFVFPAIYGAGGKSMSENFHIPRLIIDQLLEEFFDTFPGVKAWHEAQRKFYRDHGYVELLTGFRRHELMEKENAVINTTTQGTASDIVIDAMDRISEYSYQDDLPDLQPILNVHDDISWYLHESSLDDYLEQIVYQMLDCSFDFINVPLVVEVAVGENWYNKQPIGEFASDDLGIHHLAA